MPAVRSGRPAATWWDRTALRYILIVPGDMRPLVARCTTKSRILSSSSSRLSSFTRRSGSMLRARQNRAHQRHPTEYARRELSANLPRTRRTFSSSKSARVARGAAVGCSPCRSWAPRGPCKCASFTSASGAQPRCLAPQRLSTSTAPSPDHHQLQLHVAPSAAKVCAQVRKKSWYVR